MAMDSPRPKPYIWVSWLTPFLADTDKCHWKPWKKAHFRYAKVPDTSDFDLQDWIRQHNAMTETRVEKLRSQGYVVKVEEQNSFKLEGKSSTLAGKPDIVALKHDEKRALVVDEKSGKVKPQDIWQVRIYVLALRRTFLKGYTIDGEVEYRGSSNFVDAASHTNEIEEKIFSLTRLVGGDEAPPRVPSASECRFCDILNCPDRWKDETQVVAVEEF